MVCFNSFLYFFFSIIILLSWFFYVAYPGGINSILVVNGFSETTGDIKRTTPGTNISRENA